MLVSRYRVGRDQGMASRQASVVISAGESASGAKWMAMNSVGVVGEVVLVQAAPCQCSRVFWPPAAPPVAQHSVFVCEHHRSLKLALLPLLSNDHAPPVLSRVLPFCPRAQQLPGAAVQDTANK